MTTQTQINQTSKIYQLITVLKSAAPDLSIGHLEVLLAIQSHVGITQKELMGVVMLAPATLNRYVMQLRTRMVRDGEGVGHLVGMDLVEAKQDLYDLKSLQLHLTKKGHLLLERLAQVLNNNGGSNHG